MTMVVEPVHSLAAGATNDTWIVSRPRHRGRTGPLNSDCLRWALDECDHKHTPESPPPEDGKTGFPEDDDICEEDGTVDEIQGSP